MNMMPKEEFYHLLILSIITQKNRAYFMKHKSKSFAKFNLWKI